MDNGHKNAIFGSNPEVDDNLNEENWQRSLEISVPNDLPSPEEIIDTKIASTEDAELFNPENSAAQVSSPTSEHFLKQPQEFGQIIPVSQPDLVSPKLPETPQIYNPINIKTTGDRLEKSTIPEIDNIITELNQTGNLSNFYDEIRGSDKKPGMMETNLKNSYGRKLGEDS